jgi:hypothetical protein
MSRRKALPSAERISAIRKQTHEWEMPAERDEIPGTIHIRHCLQQTDDADAQYGRDDEIPRGATE